MQRKPGELLSKLFRQMATAAQAFSAGDKKLRFDKRRRDAFSVLFPHCSAGQAVRSAESILRSAVRDFRFLYHDRSCAVGVRIAVAAVTRDSRSTSERLSAADIARYAAKHGGRNRVHLYEDLSGRLFSDESFLAYLETEISAVLFLFRHSYREIAEASAISKLRSIGNSIALLRRRGCRFARDAGFIFTPPPTEDLFQPLRRKRSLVLGTS